MYYDPNFNNAQVPTLYSFANRAFMLNNGFAQQCLLLLSSKIPKSRSSIRDERPSEGTIKIWPVGGSEYSHYLFMTFEWNAPGELTIKYELRFTSYGWHENLKSIVFNSNNHQPEDVLVFVENHLEHLHDLILKKQARDVKAKFDIMGVHSKVDELISEEKADKVEFYHNDSYMELRPKSGTKGNWKATFKKHKSKKDSFSLKLKGTWKFNEEQLLKLLDAFIDSIPSKSK